MSDVDPETPEGPLDTKVDPIEFTSPRPIVCISAEFNPDDGDGPRECIYDGTDATHNNGSFSYLYRNSERLGNAWTIVRENGWPAPFKIAIKEAPNPSSATPNAALQPTLYSPVAQWALQGAPNASLVYLDRSGNGNHLTGGMGTPAPSHIPGQKAVIPLYGSRLVLDAAHAGPVRFTGSFTFSVVVKRLSAAFGQLITCSGIFNGSNKDRNTLYSLYVNPDGTLGYYWEKTMGDGAAWVATDLHVPVGSFAHISFSRDATTNRVTFGLNGAYSISPVLVPPDPTGGAAAFLTLGDQDEAADSHIDGVYGDACLWGAALDQDQKLPLLNAAMGL